MFLGLGVSLIIFLGIILIWGAEAGKLKALAEADAIKVALPIEKKAEAEKKLLEVYGQSGIMGLKLIEILPQLAKAQADAVANKILTA